MRLSLNRWLLAGSVACVLALWPRGGSTQTVETGTPAGRAGIRPALVQLAPGETQQFRAVFEPQWLHEAYVAGEVSWAVNGIPGGNDTLGAIDGEGVYRAPNEAPRPCEVHICATVDRAENPRLWATVLIGSGAPAYELVGQWQEPADGSGQLKDPLDIAVDRSGNLLISDGGHSKVLRFTPEGEALGGVGEPGGNTPGHFGELRNVDVSPDGNIVACDMRTGPPRIQVFDPDGAFLHAFAQKGIGPGQIMQPQGVAFSPAGRIYAADSDNMQVNVYENDGAFVESWRRNGVRPGDLNEPYGVIVDANGDVFVPNYYGPCQKFTANGEFVLAFGQPDPPDGLVAITSICGDQWGNVYLAVRDTAGLVQNSAKPEPRPARIMKFNNSGCLVTSFFLWEDERGENKMAVDANGRLYVLFKRVDALGVAIFEER